MPTNKSNNPKPLRLWPGVVIVILQLLARFVVPMFIGGNTGSMISVFGGLLGFIAIILWWAFFSRTHWAERVGAILLMLPGLYFAAQLTHESIRTGFQGIMPFVYIIPPLCLAFVVWAVLTRSLANGVRRATMVLTILLACGVWTLFRSNGISDGIEADLTWRWLPTAEEQLLSQTSDAQNTATVAVDSTALQIKADWPGFRGPDRNSIVPGVKIETDWTASPPKELWRQPIGPGCSSFSARGNLIYTQEQRGEEEDVSCYNLLTGQLVWRHSDEARFWDSHAGPGPRSTPTLCDSCVYTLGATGIVNVLNAQDGSVIWSRDAAKDTEMKAPGWGFTSSPLVLDDVVVVGISGKAIAYDRTTGEPRWMSKDGGEAYSSPHLITIAGVSQVVFMSLAGASSFSPSDGKLLWEHPWKGGRIVQPALAPNGELLLSVGEEKGMQRVAVTKGADGWKVDVRWTTEQLKPNFNDFVFHKGYIYGFDGPTLTCIDFEKGERVWRGKRYAGELLLLADQDLLVLVTEKGDLVLANATPDKFTEIAKIPAIKGKTWNHPALAGNILLVRNAVEVVAFQLDLTNDTEQVVSQNSI